MIDWNFAVQIMPALLEGAKLTALLTLASFGVAVIGGLALLALHRSGIPGTGRCVDFVSDFIRGTPLLVQVFAVYYVLPEYGLVLGAFATGIATFGVHFSCYLFEVYKASVDSIDKGQWEAAHALRLNRFQAFRKVVLPQTFPFVVPVAGTYLIYMIKSTPLLSVITVRETLQVASTLGAENFRYLEPYTITALIFLLMSLVASMVISVLEKKVSRPYGD